MRNLSEAERQLLEQRVQAFAEVSAEIAPVLVDFIEKLGLSDPSYVKDNPDHFLGPVDEWMARQEISKEAFHWILVRMAYFIGEVLAKRWRGCWIVNGVPDSHLFGKIVVGGFERMPNPLAMVDPFAAALRFVSRPPGRDLRHEIESVEEELRSQ